MIRPFPKWLRLAWRILILFGLYWITARAGLSLSPVGGFATLIWPPSGIALAALVVCGIRLWPGVFLGAVTVNFLTGAPLPAALGIACGNTLEAIVGALLLTRFARIDSSLRRIRDINALVILAAGASTLVAATIGVISLRVSGTLSPDDLAAAWAAWWMGDALGILVVAPLLMTWHHRLTAEAPELASTRHAMPEAVAILGSALVVSTIVFFDLYEATSLSGQRPLPFVLFPLAIWAALRFGVFGSVHTTLIVSVIAILGTIHGHGPFASGPISEALFYIDSYITIIVLSGMYLAAAVHEREKSEQEVRALLRSRDEFLSVASHELKTPLTSLKLQLEVSERIIQRSGSRPVDPGITESAIRLAITQVNRLGSLVESLLNVSRIQAGKLSYELQDVDLSKAVQESLALLSLQLDAAASRVTQKLEPGLVGHWNQSGVEQIVINLVSNSIKYARSSPIRVLTRREGAHAALIVEDDGPGIPKDQHELIFERFERATRDRGTPGLGLGLFIVRNIVVVLGGEIRVESEPGKGARFIVRLPLKSA